MSFRNLTQAEESVKKNQREEQKKLIDQKVLKTHRTKNIYLGHFLKEHLKTRKKKDIILYEGDNLELVLSKTKKEVYNKSKRKMVDEETLHVHLHKNKKALTNTHPNSIKEGGFGLTDILYKLIRRRIIKARSIVQNAPSKLDQINNNKFYFQVRYELYLQNDNVYEPIIIDPKNDSEQGLVIQEFRKNVQEIHRMLTQSFLNLSMLQNRQIDLTVRNRRKLRVNLDALDSADPLYEKDKEETGLVDYQKLMREHKQRAEQQIQWFEQMKHQIRNNYPEYGRLKEINLEKLPLHVQIEKITKISQYEAQMEPHLREVDDKIRQVQNNLSYNLNQQKKLEQEQFEKVKIMEAKEKREIEEKLANQKDIFDPFQNLPDWVRRPDERFRKQKLRQEKQKKKSKMLKENEDEDEDESENESEDEGERIDVDLEQTPIGFKKDSQLKPYQLEALTWMMIREGQNANTELAVIMEEQYKVQHPLWIKYELPDKKPLYLNPYNGQLCLQFPIAYKRSYGGILADEMGLGKTVMTLALILAHPRPNAKQIRKKLFRSSGINYVDSEEEDSEDQDDEDDDEDEEVQKIKYQTQQNTQQNSKSQNTKSKNKMREEDDDEYDEEDEESYNRNNNREEQQESDDDNEDSDDSEDDDSEEEDDDIFNTRVEKKIKTKNAQEEKAILLNQLQKGLITVDEYQEKLEYNENDSSSSDSDESSEKLVEQAVTVYINVYDQYGNFLGQRAETQMQVFKKKQLRKRQKKQEETEEKEEQEVETDEDEIDIKKAIKLKKKQNKQKKKEQKQREQKEKEKQQEIDEVYRKVKKINERNRELENSNSNIFRVSQPQPQKQENKINGVKTLRQGTIQTNKQNSTTTVKGKLYQTNKQAGTLVIVPQTLLAQWQNEVKKHLDKNTISTVEFYGPKRFGIQVQNYDVVFTTYDMVTQDYDEAVKKEVVRRTPINTNAKPKKERKQKPDHKRKILFNVNWYRVVLDEGHKIGNKNTIISQAVMNLKVQYKWVLTGTPIQNKMESIYPFMKFIGHFPWDNWQEFDDVLSKPQQNNNDKVMPVLQGILKPIMIRRTKKSKNRYGENILNLPKKHYHSEYIDFEPREKRLYDDAFNKMKNKFNALVTEGGIPYMAGMQLLTRMRQQCDHYAILQKIYNPFKNWQSIEKQIRNFAQNMGTKVRKIDTTEEEMVVEMDGRNVTLAEIHDRHKEDGDEKKVNKDFIDTLVQKIEQNDYDVCEICDEEMNSMIVTKCLHVYCQSCSNNIFDSKRRGTDQECSCPMCRTILKRTEILNLVKDKPFTIGKDPSELPPSTKLKAVLTQVKDIISDSEGDDKIVIFSYFKAMSDLLKTSIEKELGEEVLLMSGSLSQQKKKEALEKFEKKGKYPVFISTLTAGNVGLNLTIANHVIMVSPWWNPTQELQAEERVHRMGQTKEVHVYRYYINDSVEIRIKELQDKKKVLMGYALGTSSGKKQTLNVDDFKKLFEGFTA